MLDRETDSIPFIHIPLEFLAVMLVCLWCLYFTSCICVVSSTVFCFLFYFENVLSLLVLTCVLLPVSVPLTDWCVSPVCHYVQPSWCIKLVCCFHSLHVIWSTCVSCLTSVPHAFSVFWIFSRFMDIQLFGSGIIMFYILDCLTSTCHWIYTTSGFIFPPLGQSHLPSL